MNSSWHSYPSIYQLGHRAIENLFDNDVLCEEKIDGSQISFGVFDGILKVRSKGKEIIVDAPEKMFAIGVENIKTLDLKDGWTYRGEFLNKPKHNTLCYSRIPVKNIIIFDINRGEEDYLSPQEKKEECDRIGLECVPLLYQGKIDNPAFIHKFLERESILGGIKIEGVVIKNYQLFGKDKKVLMGKYVSEVFKEVHDKEWKHENKTGKDIIRSIIEYLKTEARYNKSIQHLKELGELENSPKDIGKLLVEIKNDIKKECEEEIKEKLYIWAHGHIERGVIAGFPMYYKEYLLKEQFK